MLRSTFALVLVLLFVPSSRASELKALMVTAEIAGIYHSGGLGHATPGLTQALNEAKVKTDMIMPYYLNMKTPAALKDEGEVIRVGLDLRDGSAQKISEFSVYSTAKAKGQVLLLKHNSSRPEFNYFDNRKAEGYTPYGPVVIEGEAFGAWSKAVAEYILQSQYDVVILNDWHCGLVAVFLEMAREQGRKVPKVITAIHNIAMQGIFPKDLARFLGIPESYVKTNGGIEYYNQVSFLKAGLQYSTFSYTVSNTYALEIATPRSGQAFDGIIRELQSEYRMTGVMNGIINSQWDPAKSYHPDVKWTFTPEDMMGKAKGKAFIQKEFGLKVDASTPVFVFTSRVSEQKGFEYLIDALAEVAPSVKAQFILIGDGEPGYIARLKDLQDRHPDKIQYRAFSERSEKILMAYGDVFVNAPWFEPSGLNQLFAQRNGTLPLVSRVGGLVDSVVEGMSGFFFDIEWRADGNGYDKEATKTSLAQGIRRVAKDFETEPEKIQEMRKFSMKIDNSWSKRVSAQFMPMFRYALEDGPALLQSRSRNFQRNGSAGLSPSDLYRLASGRSQSRALTCRAAF